MTVETHCKFELQEIGTSQYAVACRLQAPAQAVKDERLLLLRLRAGVTFGFAEQVTKFLQQNIVSLVMPEPK
jgi:hypothetical protein